MKRLKQINGIKIIALLMIFWWHSDLPLPKMDFGARGCEIFFLISGFLFCYSYKNKPISPTIKDSFLYAQKKLSVFFPLHLCTLFMRGTINCFFCVEIDVWKAVLNVLLLQSWSTDETVYFSFNGVSWFLSSLMFCVFLSPFLARLIKNPKWKVLYFPFVLGLEFVVCANIGNVCGIFHIFPYISPIVRMFEYFLGMMIADFYLSAVSKSEDNRNILFTMSELIVIAAYVFLASTRTEWNRAWFVFLFGVVLFVFSFDKGMISFLLSNKLFQMFSNIQFEFYMFHSTALILMRKFIPSATLQGAVMRFAAAFAVTVIMSAVYRKLLKQKLEEVMKWLFGKMNRWGLE